METNKTQIVKNLQEKSILVSREFDATLINVWRCYTESELLDQWWAPQPWRAQTKIMDFSIGGYWLYAMISPENEKHWGRMNYIAIDLHKSFTLEDVFCNENGNINSALPISKGSNIFTKTENGTLVEFKLRYNSKEDLQKIIDMGMEQGIKMCQNQLEILLTKIK